MFNKAKEISTITDYASVATNYVIPRVSALKKALKAGVKIHRRQFGNIINDLNNLKEFDIISEIRAQIEKYNRDVKRHNQMLVEAKRIAKRDKVSIQESFDTLVEQAIDL